MPRPRPIPTPTIRPYDWQLPAIADQTRVLRERGSAINGSDTGTGKTIMACASLKELGLRPIVIAPPITLPSWKRTLAAFGITPYALASWEKLQRGLDGLCRVEYCTNTVYPVMVPNHQPWTRILFDIPGHKPSLNYSTREGRWVLSPAKAQATWTPHDNKSPPPAEPPVAVVDKDGKFTAVPLGPGKRVRRVTKLDWTLPDDAIVVADEFHKAGNADTINSKLMVACPRVLMLSATVANNPTRMKALGTKLGLFQAPDYFAWMFRHGVKRGYFGGFEFVEDRREAVLKKLHAEIYPALGCRVRWTDVPGYPGTTILPEIYEQDEVPATQVKELVDRLAVLEAKALDDQAQDKPEITLMLREREFLETMKLPILLQLALEAIGNSRSVVIFVSFRHSLAWLKDRFQDKPALIWGAQSPAERERNVQLFQANKTRVCVAQIGAGGVGVNLDDVHGEHPREALICPTFSVVELKQALGRIHRATAKSPSLQRIVYLAGTVEEKICRVVKTKLDNLDLLNDGDVRNVILNHLTEKEE